MRRSFASATFAALLSLVAYAGAQVQPSRSSTVIFAAGNPDLYGYDADFSSSGASLSLDSAKSWTGLDSTGGTRTMTFGGLASAYSEYGRLHTSVDAELSNVFYNPGNSIYFQNGPGATPDDEGVPDTFLATGLVSFTDRLAFGGGAFTGYKARYKFFIDGMASGSNVSASLRCAIAGNSFEQYDVDFSSGPIAQYWTTDAYDVGASFEQTANVQFTTRFDADASAYADGDTIRGAANFSSTITLAAVMLYDPSGNLVSNYTVTGASGAVYPVPEPASLGVLGLGVAAVLRRRRKA